MNTMIARISDIQSVDSLNLVSFELEDQFMRMISLDLPEGLSKNSQVLLGVKASHISLAKQKNEDLSISNQLQVNIESLSMGELLCSVKFRLGKYLMESIITKDSALRMQLQENTPVIALIKSSDLSIVEIL